MTSRETSTVFGSAYIYGISDPRNGTVRYVGKTIDMVCRAKDHRNDAKRGSTLYVHKWMRSLTTLGIQPEMKVLEIVPKATWELAEQWWISFFKGQGIRLTNLTTGGEGANGTKGRKKTPEQRLAMSIARKGKSYGPRGPYRAGTGAKISAALKGRKVPREIVDRVALKLKGKTPWNKGKKIIWSPEARANNAARKAQQSSWSKGIKFSAERQKIHSEGQLRRFARERELANRISN